MSRQTLLIVILIVLVVGAAGYWYVIHQNNVSSVSIEDMVATTTVADTVQKEKTVIVQKDTVVSSAMEFDPMKVQVGEKFGAFTVTNSNYWPTDKTYFVTFKGPLVIRGTLTDTEPGMCDAMLEVSPSTAEMLPRVSGTEVESTKFYLSLDEEHFTYNEAGLTTSSGELIQEGDTLEVTIDILRKSYQGKDCSGNRIEVTSLKKISS